MRNVVKELMNDRPLAKVYLDHPLTGQNGERECHVESDWLLIYKKSGDVKTGDLQLIRTGSHSELF
jgi:mRNA interferase YafQ